MVAAACLLTACVSTPPAPSSTRSPAWTPMPRPSSATAPASAPSTSAAAPTTSAPAVAEPAFSAGVLARFPDLPSRPLSAPGLQPGRSEFTTQAELSRALRDLRWGAASGTHVEVLSLGQSQQGQALEAVLFTRQPDPSPAALLRSGVPTVVFIGQQHGDEPAPAEALLVLADDLAKGRFNKVLERINVIVMPRANPDGAATAERATANGTDANRDHLLLLTPETQAQARLMREYRPLVVVDAHEYPAVQPFLEHFGLLPRHDVMLQYATTAGVHPFITKAAEEWFRVPLVNELKRQGLSVEWFHMPAGELLDKHVAMGSPQPDTARNAHGLRHAVSLLLETRGGGLGRLHLQRRVMSQLAFFSVVLRQASDRAADLRKLRQYVEADVAAQACQGQLVIDAQPTPTEYNLTMLDPSTGADRPITVSWDSALVLDGRRTRIRPCGYWLPADQADAVTHLRNLGLTVHQLSENGVVQGEVFATQPADGMVVAAAPVRGRGLTLVDAPAGSFYVPMSQPFAPLAAAALEPDTAFSYASQRLLAPGRAVRVLALPSVRMGSAP